jgi:ribosome-binding protein aMBF1 (putative translation factor)
VERRIPGVSRSSSMTPKELRSRRLALALSVAELARELRMPVECVREMESGDVPLTEHALIERTFAKIEARKRVARESGRRGKK